MPGTNYNVSDGTTGTVPVRIPNAGDTTADDTPIPQGAVAIVGIVGQFDTADPTAGYQLLVLSADDVNPDGVAAEGAPEGALTLDVPNPLRGAATVRFAVGTPGRATLALYDALGRRVATLADGVVGATAQTATLDTGALASGVYVLRLEADGAALSRTLTVVR